MAPNTLHEAAGRELTAAASGVASLFRPFFYNRLTLKTRIVMAPMTRGFSPGGVPTEDVAEYYARRARNGVGLIITEGTIIDHPTASPGSSIPNFFGEEALRGWARVRERVHAEGGRIMPQLWHAGIARDPSADVPNRGLSSSTPSGIDSFGRKVLEPMTDAAIADVIDAFARAAADARRLGFDGVELHGAHGYLIDAFFWDRTNRRTDAYGGKMRERTRFAVEIIRAIRARVGPDFPVTIRLSQWKSGQYDATLWETPTELSVFLGLLLDAGIDMFHMSTRRFWLPAFQGSSLPLAAWVKKITDRPVITVGSVGLSGVFERGVLEASTPMSVDALVERLEQNEFDLVAVGRALLADPEWASKLRDGREGELIGYSPEAQNALW